MADPATLVLIAFAEHAITAAGGACCLWYFWESGEGDLEDPERYLSLEDEKWHENCQDEDSDDQQITSSWEEAGRHNRWAKADSWLSKEQPTIRRNTTDVTADKITDDEDSAQQSCYKITKYDSSTQ